MAVAWLCPENSSSGAMLVTYSADTKDSYTEGFALGRDTN